MSYSDDKTDAKLKALERKIAREYQRSYEEMEGKASQYFEKYKARWEKEHQAFLDGEYTEVQFKNWEHAQLGRGERWEVLRDDLAQRMTNANQVASAYINDSTPSIYTLNANYGAYQIAHSTGTEGSAWNLVDEQTVKELISGKGNHKEFKTTRINPERDYEWNSRQIQKALNASIMQGKTIGELSDAFYTVMKRNRTSAIRNARTSYTSAQNAGRTKALERAQEMGIEVQKKWTCTHDERTRFSHAMLDGQIRDVKKPFSNGLMFPADADGIPAEVYNCRCTLTYVYPEYDNQTSNDQWDEMTAEEKAEERKKYKEWQKAKSV